MNFNPTIEPRSSTSSVGERSYQEQHNYFGGTVPEDQIERDQEGRWIWSDTGLVLTADEILLVEDE